MTHLSDDRAVAKMGHPIAAERQVRLNRLIRPLRLSAGSLVAFLCDCASDIRKELFGYAEADVAGHGDSEAVGAVSCGVCTGGLPRARQKCSGRHSSNLRDRDVPGAVIMASEDTARECVSGARPKAGLAGVEVAIVFVQNA